MAHILLLEGISASGTGLSCISPSHSSKGFLKCCSWGSSHDRNSRVGGASWLPYSHLLVESLHGIQTVVYNWGNGYFSADFFFVIMVSDLSQDKTKVA